MLDPLMEFWDNRTGKSFNKQGGLMEFLQNAKCMLDIFASQCAPAFNEALADPTHPGHAWAVEARAWCARMMEQAQVLLETCEGFTPEQLSFDFNAALASMAMNMGGLGDLAQELSGGLLPAGLLPGGLPPLGALVGPAAERAAAEGLASPPPFPGGLPLPRNLFGGGV